MQDELVTRETALLAKELGFNEPCYYLHDSVYGPIENGKWHCNSKINVNGDTSNLVALPAQSLLQRWLREVCKIDICVARSFSMTNSYHYYIEENKLITEAIQQEVAPNRTYEQALEAGLLYSLNLIKSCG